MRFIVFIYSLLFIQNLFCQDTIRFKSGELKAVKVEEVGLNQVSYSRLDIVDGPLYTVAKSEVVYIKYKNGQTDKFDALPEGNTASVQMNHLEVNFVPKERILIFGSKLNYNEKSLKDKGLLKLINEYPENASKIKLQATYHQMDDYKAKQYLVGFLGAGMAFNIAVSSVLAGGKTGSNIGMILALGTYFTTSTISKSFKRKRAVKRVETARIYNGEL